MKSRKKSIWMAVAVCTVMSVGIFTEGTQYPRQGFNNHSQVLSRAEMSKLMGGSTSMCNAMCNTSGVCPANTRQWFGSDDCVSGWWFWKGCNNSCHRCAGATGVFAFCEYSEDEEEPCHTYPGEFVNCGAKTDIPCTGSYPSCVCPTTGGTLNGTCSVSKC